MDMAKSNVEQWPRKVLCQMCEPNHMVDARGIKMHQMKVQTERQAMASEAAPEAGMQSETFHYKSGWVDGYRAALGDKSKVA